ncbi:MAG: SSU ribosomal protein S5p (S2e) [Candidatus Bipolaricaulis sibiricus]|uniref:Small ribosomal subunit protein uS5 n=1 Tax=Bipolaricaulis sibiricus TaxID=2501609 RepID=A0A410FU14_BIPS1|nr:MAG: SSU ribosomal protein S5p (S2e) [Candidatus Bipolaricaulis sibiricus]
MARYAEQPANEVIDIRRVGKVTKGGKRLRFRVVVVAGDGAGRVGVGVGKSVEIPQAVQQAIRDAMKRLVTVPIQDGTIPHEVRGQYGAAKVLLRPAYPGTGVIAGRTVGAVCRIAGIRNILTKALRSTNPLNLARATLDGFRQMEGVEMVAARRGKTVEEILEVEDAEAR